MAEDNAGRQNWRRWGPYLSERQWGTVREDYSPGGTAWEYLPHDHARSRAYRWGEDGIAGFSDDMQHFCFSLALWNGKDPILKERLFGLTNSEGNHGEDVKELYYSGFPIWFVAHDQRGLFFTILLIFVLLHSFATHFFSPSPVFPGAGGVSTPFLAPLPGFSRM